MIWHAACRLGLDIEALHAHRANHADIVGYARRNPDAALRLHDPGAIGRRQHHKAGRPRDQLSAPVMMRRD